MKKNESRAEGSGQAFEIESNVSSLKMEKLDKRAARSIQEIVATAYKSGSIELFLYAESCVNKNCRGRDEMPNFQYLAHDVWLGSTVASTKACTFTQLHQHQPDRRVVIHIHSILDIIENERSPEPPT